MLVVSRQTLKTAGLIVARRMEAHSRSRGYEDRVMMSVAMKIVTGLLTPSLRTRGSLLWLSLRRLSCKGGVVVARREDQDGLSLTPSPL